MIDENIDGRIRCQREVPNGKGFEIFPIFGGRRRESYVEMRIFLQSDTSIIFKVAEVPKSFLKASRLTEPLWYAKKSSRTIAKSDDQCSRCTTMGFVSGRVLSSTKLTSVRVDCSSSQSIFT